MIRKTDLDRMSFGMEIEWGDIPRSRIIPASLGSWDYSEVDIVNLTIKRAADPLGLDPTIGGEINTYPTVGIDGQVKIFAKLLKLFPESTVSTMAETHIHVHVPNLKNDIRSLKRFMLYVKKYQHQSIEKCLQFKDRPDMSGARAFMKLDAGRPTPDYIVENISQYAVDFDSFIKLHCTGKDAVTMGRPFRYAINTYSLKRNSTIEFRLFRGTKSVYEITNCLMFVKSFVQNALTTFKPPATELKFPAMIWEREHFEIWRDTKYDKSRCKSKEGKFIEL